MRQGNVWEPVLSVGRDGCIVPTKTGPPKSPSEFEQMNQRLVYTNGADRSMVAQLYERTLRNALGAAEVLWFMSMMDDTIAVTLSRSLRLLPSLRELRLDQGQIGDVGLSAIAGSISCGAFPSLRELSLWSNPLGPHGFRALGAAASSARAGETPRLPKLARLTLKQCRFAAGDLSGFADALVEGALPSLGNICAYMTDIDKMDVEAFGRALDRRALPCLRELGVGARIDAEAQKVWGAKHAKVKISVQV